MNTPLRFAMAFIALTLLAPLAFSQASWRSDDIGSVMLSGRSTDTNGTIEIVGSGADIWDNADSFHFRHQSWTGDGEIVARVTSLQNTHAWAKVGVMIRETTQAGSRHAMMCVTPVNGPVFQYRSTTNGPSATSNAAWSGATPPIWIKIARAGQTVTGFTSSNGTTWTQVGTITFSGLSATVSAGIALTSHDQSVQCTARLDSLTIRGPGPSEPPPPGAPVITPRGSESVQSGGLYTYQIAATNSPTSYGASGLPAGLTLNTTTGEIRGVCGHNAGTYTVTLRATNAAGTGTATQTMIVDGNTPIEMPSIGHVTTPAAGTYRAGDTLVFVMQVYNGYSYPYVTGRPRFAFTLGGNTRYANYAWGSGEQYHTYTYTVVTADASSTGVTTSDTVDLNGGTMQDSYPLWCALNMTPVTNSSVVIATGSSSPTAAPVLSTPDVARGLFGQPFSFQITASNAPTSYSMTIAPSPTRPLGVSLDAATGVISGTIQASGNYTVTLRATNSVGTGSKNVTISVPHSISNIAMPAPGTYRAGDTLSFRVTFSNPIRVTGTPSIPINLGSAWRHAAYAFGSEREHTFSYAVQAGDVDLDGTILLGPAISLASGTIQDAESGANFGPSGVALPRNSMARDVIVDAPGSPVPQITSPGTASATVGAPFSYSITATNSPTSYNAWSLPAGLSVNTSTGVISGTLTTAGTWVIEIGATNSGGTARKYVNLTASAGSTAWQSRDIGAVAAAGSSSEADGVVTLRASGADIWDNADEFHFRYQTLNGDGEIIARLTSLTDTHPWAKAGLMFRESLEPGSRHVWLCMASAHGLSQQFRGTTNGISQMGQTTATSLPIWLRVVRSGAQISCYTSHDGMNWTQFSGLGGTGHPTTMYVGLALTSHNDGVIGTATFDNVRLSGPTPPSGPPSAPDLSVYAASAREINLGFSTSGFSITGYEIERSSNGTTFARIATVGTTSYMDTDVIASTTYHYRVRALSSEGPSPYSEIKSATTPAAPPPGTAWDFRDIGTVGVAGSNSSSGNTITINGSGHDIWENADGFRFVYRQIYGNVVVEAQVSSLTNTNPWAKAGVMIRQSLSPDARNVFAFVTPNLVAAQARASTGASTVINTASWTPAPYWVRLVRNGTRITAFSSPNGLTWTEIAGYDVAMTETVYVGFAVTSHDNAQLATAVFTDPFIE